MTTRNNNSSKKQTTTTTITMQLQTLFWMVKSEHMALSDYNTRSNLQISLRSDHLSIDIA